MRKIPTWKEKQDYLYNTRKQASPERLIEFGNACMQQRLFHDALEYFQSASYQKGIKEVLVLAIEAGDFFLLNKIHYFDRSLVSDVDIQTAQTNAQKLSKVIFVEKLATFKNGSS